MLLTRQSLKPMRPMLNIAAMIDVVFLLLIFFMCTTSFEAVDKNLAAQIPQVSGDPSEESDFEPIRIELRQAGAETGAEAGTGAVGGEVQVFCDGLKCGGFGELGKMLEQRRAIADIAVIIAGEDEIDYENLVRVMDICYEVGFSRVAFSAK